MIMIVNVIITKTFQVKRLNNHLLLDLIIKNKTSNSIDINNDKF